MYFSCKNTVEIEYKSSPQHNI